MKNKLRIFLILFMVVFLQACSGTRDRMSIISSLSDNDLSSFKTEIYNIKSDIEYTEEEKGELLYDALIHAASTNEDATLFLIEQGTPVNYPNNDHENSYRGMPLSNAVVNNKPGIVKILLEHGADPNIEIAPVEPDEDNILLLALSHDDLVIPELLLEAGANPNQWTSLFTTSLVDLFSSRQDIVILLEKYGGVASPTQAQRFGYTVIKPTAAVQPQIPKKVQQSRVENNVKVPLSKTTSKAIAKNTIPESETNQSDKILKPAVEPQLNIKAESIKQRLQNLEVLKSDGVISDAEYSQARSRILSEL